VCHAPNNMLVPLPLPATYEKVTLAEAQALSGVVTAFNQLIPIFNDTRTNLLAWINAAWTDKDVSSFAGGNDNLKLIVEQIQEALTADPNALEITVTDQIAQLPEGTTNREPIKATLLQLIKQTHSVITLGNLKTSAVTPEMEKMDLKLSSLTVLLNMLINNLNQIQQIMAALASVATETDKRIGRALIYTKFGDVVTVLHNASQLTSVAKITTYMKQTGLQDMQDRLEAIVMNLQALAVPPLTKDKSGKPQPTGAAAQLMICLPEPRLSGCC